MDKLDDSKTDSLAVIALLPDTSLYDASSIHIELECPSVLISTPKLADKSAIVVPVYVVCHTTPISALSIAFANGDPSRAAYLIVFG